jgi:hypothetical protein
VGHFVAIDAEAAIDAELASRVDPGWISAVGNPADIGDY